MPVPLPQSQPQLHPLPLVPSPTPSPSPSMSSSATHVDRDGEEVDRKLSDGPGKPSATPSSSHLDQPSASSTHVGGDDDAGSDTIADLPPVPMSSTTTTAAAAATPSDLGAPIERKATRISIKDAPASQKKSTAGKEKDIGAVTSSDQPAPGSQPPAFSEIKRSVTSDSRRPYSAFSPGTKWLVAGLGGIAAIFSPISSNIYVPAIPIMSTAFGRTQEDISLGVTIYLVFQAITPSFFGSMSDTYGRRPVYIGTMIVYIGANIGLALMPTSSYWLLLFLRALQATGGSAVISIGAGAVNDVAEPREKGKYMAVFQVGAMFGPAIGPLLGGVFAQTLGWRAIFWFLTIAAVVVLTVFILVFPETLRSLVGDGSIPPPTICSSPTAIITRRKLARERAAAGLEEEHIERPPKKPYQPLSAFMILFVPEILLIFIFVSLLYLEFYCTLTVYSTALKDTYGLNELMIGLCYLPSGAGTILSSLINGRQLDYYYRKEENRVGGDYRKKPDDFRVELTRIRCILPFMAVFCCATVALGWCLQAKAPLAVTLIMQFLVGLGTGTINTATVYGQDLLPGKGGAVSASLNLVRCAFGAIGTGVVQIMYSNLGAGWTFVLLSGICVAGLPLPWLVNARARRWREWRRRKAEEGGVGGGLFKSEKEDADKARAEARREDEVQGEAGQGREGGDGEEVAGGVLGEGEGEGEGEKKREEVEIGREGKRDDSGV